MKVEIPQQDQSKTMRKIFGDVLPEEDKQNPRTKPPRPKTPAPKPIQITLEKFITDNNLQNLYQDDSEMFLTCIKIFSLHYRKMRRRIKP